MESFFSPEFFGRNRQKLQTLFTGKAPIVLAANGQLQRSGDTTFPFRQDSNFWYLTGIDEPDLILVLDKGSEYLILPERGHVMEVFDGKIDTGTLKKRSGIEEIYSHKEGWKKLEGKLKKVKHIATLSPMPAYIEQLGFYTNPARANLLESLKRVNSSVEVLDLREHLSLMRMIKQPEELAAMKRAGNITFAALKKIKRGLAGIKNEYEIEAELTRNFRRNNAVHAYAPIIAGGNNATTLHYVSNNDKLLQKQLLLIDVGAEVEHYAADITRTFSLGHPSKRQQDVYDAVADVQAFAMSLLMPGVIMKDYELAVVHYMGEKLRELGLIKTVSKESVRKFFPHGSSHFLGLDVHDAGDYERPLEPGVVLTIEPGIYIEKEGIGVRLEDNVVITKHGAKHLTKPTPLVLQ